MLRAVAALVLAAARAAPARPEAPEARHWHIVTPPKSDPQFHQLARLGPVGFAGDVQNGGGGPRRPREGSRREHSQQAQLEAAEKALREARLSEQCPLDAGMTFPHLWGKPCAAGGHCPFGPSCLVCGNYCGPGWCGSGCVPEGSGLCDFDAPSQSGSCTDACCKVHDQCCGCWDAETRAITPACDASGCNHALTSCLGNCSKSDRCTGDDGAWGPTSIKLAFQVIGSRCCGSKCPPDTFASESTLDASQLAYLKTL